MNSRICDKCDCVAGCSKNPEPCPNLLAECIASGQVSAAQIERHRAAGELTSHFRICNSAMTASKAIAQTFTSGLPDFPGQKYGITFSPGGPGKLIDCLKCQECGWSVTNPKEAESSQKDAEIAALRAQLEAVGAGGVSGQLMGAQPGWKLVPTTMSKGMNYAVQDGADVLPARASRIWKMLLDAAPQSPTAQPATFTPSNDYCLGYNAAKKEMADILVSFEITAQPAEPYDQTSLGLCSVCGWKALIPGDCCLNCERDKTTQPQQSAVMPNFARYRDDDLFCEMERVPDGMWVMYDDVAAAWPKATNPTEGTT